MFREAEVVYIRVLQKQTKPSTHTAITRTYLVNSLVAPIPENA